MTYLAKVSPLLISGHMFKCIIIDANSLARMMEKLDDAVILNFGLVKE